MSNSLIKKSFSSQPTIAMAVFNSWNSPLRSHTFLCSLFFFYFVITLYYFPLHANALSFNLTNIDPTVKNIVIEGDAYVSNKGIQIIPVNEVWKAGRATYKDPLHLWDKASGKLTDFHTYLLFVIDSEGNSSFADGFAFSLVPNDFTPMNAFGAAMGLPILSIYPPKQAPFVAVEFDTFQNVDWDPLNITPVTHVGISINSLKSNVTAIWHNNITHGKENEAWISYNSKSKTLRVVFTGYINNKRIESSLSYQVDLRKYLPEWVTVGGLQLASQLRQEIVLRNILLNHGRSIQVCKSMCQPIPVLVPALVPE